MVVPWLVGGMQLGASKFRKTTSFRASLFELHSRERTPAKLPVGAAWGIGSRDAARLADSRSPRPVGP